MPKGRFWTIEDDEALKKLFSVMSREDLARGLNRSLKAIGARAGLLGLLPRRPIAENKLLLRQALLRKAAGMPQREIARRLKVPPGRLLGLLWRHSAKRNQPTGESVRDVGQPAVRGSSPH